MLVLVFHVGKDRYGLSTAQIERVLPLLECRHVPGAPSWVAGLANYHGRAVPVLDLVMLASGAAATECLDTRIVLTKIHPGDDVRSGPELLGLIAERVSGLERLDDDELCHPGIGAPDEAGYLGRIATKHGMLQLVEVEHLLPEHVRAMLFPPREEPC